MPCTSGVSGRQKFAFEDRSKRRKLKQLRKTVGLPEVTHTNKICLRSAGKTDATKFHSEALVTTPRRTLSIQKVWAARAKNTGLFKMIVGVLKTCHTQYT